MAGGNAKVKHNKDVKQVVKSMLSARVEHKRAVALGAAVDLPTAGVIHLVSAIAQGDDIGNRSGDMIRPVRLKIRVQFAQLAANFNSFSGRVIIFQDMTQGGAVATVGSVLDSASPLSAFTSVWRAENRFKILYDREESLVGQTPRALVNFHVSLPMKGVIRYIGTSAAIGSCGRGNIFALFITNAAAAGANQYAWSYELEYTDA
nr:structural protein [Riboviria sp.]